MHRPWFGVALVRTMADSGTARALTGYQSAMMAALAIDAFHISED
jgi:hypothetical protein